MKNIVVKQNEERIIPFLWTGRETEVNYDIKLSHEDSSVIFLGLLIGKKLESLSLKINVEHAALRTKSKIIIKSTLTDSAKVDFEGLVKIQKGAKGTDAYLAAHILLLSEKAKGRAIPSLEILENDIKAGHGTTVGRINDLEIFYLMSRGLSRAQAKKVIVEGFLQDIIIKFPEKLAKMAQKEINHE